MFAREKIYKKYTKPTLWNVNTKIIIKTKFIILFNNLIYYNYITNIMLNK